MKKNFTYLLPAFVLAIVLFSGCFGNKTANPAPTPQGTFNGEFRLLHRSHGVTKIDTTKATIQLVLETGGTYKVLGDTSTVHAGSKGNFTTMAGSVINFQDNTFSTTGANTKIHLIGSYNYFYDGSSALQMVINSSDTLSIQYDLKRTN